MQIGRGVPGRKAAPAGDRQRRLKHRGSEQVAGIILWEAKRAQRWSGLWPAKLKEDMRQAGTVAGVIVTTSFPSDWPDGKLFGLYEGVWLTSAAAAIPMAAVLRGLKPIPELGCRVGRCVDGVWEQVCDQNPGLSCGLKPIPAIGCRIGRCVDGVWEQVCD